MGGKGFFFAGGGTGGHIYPGIAVAEKIAELCPGAKVHFFISNRDIDSRILGKARFESTVLPAVGVSANPLRWLSFYKAFRDSERIAAEAIEKADSPVVIGIGGFVAAPACRAAYRLGVPVVLINVDIVPGKANRMIARWAGRIFVQWEETLRAFGKSRARVEVVGCPLRSAFDAPDPQRARGELKLRPDKKLLLITGASSGSQRINRTLCELLPQIEKYRDTWQIVHLTGRGNLEEVKAEYEGLEIEHAVVAYYDEMANLLSAADLCIGRSGAVSVAEYAASGVPCICMPYPHHKDMHQYLNASKLVEVGAAIIVDDVADDNDRKEWLWQELEPLLRDAKALAEMGAAAESVAAKDNARHIAEALLGM